VESRTGQEKGGLPATYKVEIWTKDFRNFKLTFLNGEIMSHFTDILGSQIHPEDFEFASKSSHILHETSFAIKHHEALKLNDESEGVWEAFKEPLEEFERQGLSIEQHSSYRLYQNHEYKTCQSYPRTHIVPKLIEDYVLYESSKFRTKNRFPSLTWYDKVTHCSIWRSSQTKVSPFIFQFTKYFRPAS
jgi:hypothetical protein